MPLQYAILGFLSWQPLTGYDLKKQFAAWETFPWSGNNNQIYTALVQLHRAALVSKEVEQPEHGPARKVYTITTAGLAALRQWLLSPPELPQVKHLFLAQLAWADQLAPEELDELLGVYEEEIYVKLLMVQEQAQRPSDAPQRTPRERYLWAMIQQNWRSFYEHELAWVRQVRQEVQAL